MVYNLKNNYKMIKKIYLTISLILFFANISYSQENFFEEAKKLFETKNYEDSKFLFQRNITFNPKNADSYLYLAKIFKIEENIKEEEKNLNTTILLDPKNEEAIYLLMDIEIERSNFAKVIKLKKNFESICTNLCPKISSIDEKLKNFDTKNES
tara:strand:- start:653 stop:1114 length:462 start_codon:yes stop_codon:yes gene_type:complete